LKRGMDILLDAARCRKVANDIENYCYLSP
jgi:hypothetical protein